MVVQLLYFPGCPHLDAARAVLRRVIDEVNAGVDVIEVDVTAAGTPVELRSWGSPTILIDGQDVAGGAPSGRSCRLYAGSDNPGVPPVHLLRAALIKT
jgi:mercuric ion transport protein